MGCYETGEFCTRVFIVTIYGCMSDLDETQFPSPTEEKKFYYLFLVLPSLGIPIFRYLDKHQTSGNMNVY